MLKNFTKSTLSLFIVLLYLVFGQEAKAETTLLESETINNASGVLGVVENNYKIEDSANEITIEEDGKINGQIIGYTNGGSYKGVIKVKTNYNTVFNEGATVFGGSNNLSDDRLNTIQVYDNNELTLSNYVNSYIIRGGYGSNYSVLNIEGEGDFFEYVQRFNEVNIKKDFTISDRKKLESGINTVNIFDDKNLTLEKQIVTDKVKGDGTLVIGQDDNLETEENEETSVTLIVADLKMNLGASDDSLAEVDITENDTLELQNQAYVGKIKGGGKLTLNSDGILVSSDDTMTLGADGDVLAEVDITENDTLELDKAAYVTTMNVTGTLDATDANAEINGNVVLKEDGTLSMYQNTIKGENTTLTLEESLSTADLALGNDTVVLDSVNVNSSGKTLTLESTNKAYVNNLTVTDGNFTIETDVDTSNIGAVIIESGADTLTGTLKGVNTTLIDNKSLTKSTAGLSFGTDIVHLGAVEIGTGQEFTLDNIDGFYVDNIKGAGKLTLDSDGALVSSDSIVSLGTVGESLAEVDITEDDILELQNQAYVGKIKGDGKLTLDSDGTLVSSDNTMTLGASGELLAEVDITANDNLKLQKQVYANKIKGAGKLTLDSGGTLVSSDDTMTLGASDDSLAEVDITTGDTLDLDKVVFVTTMNVNGTLDATDANAEINGNVVLKEGGILSMYENTIKGADTTFTLERYLRTYDGTAGVKLGNSNTSLRAMAINTGGVLFLQNTAYVTNLTTNTGGVLTTVDTTTLSEVTTLTNNGTLNIYDTDNTLRRKLTANSFNLNSVNGNGIINIKDNGIVFADLTADNSNAASTINLAATNVLRKPTFQIKIDGNKTNTALANQINVNTPSILFVDLENKVNILNGNIYTVTESASFNAELKIYSEDIFKKFVKTSDNDKLVLRVQEKSVSARTKGSQAASRINNWDVSNITDDKRSLVTSLQDLSTDKEFADALVDLSPDVSGALNQSSSNAIVQNMGNIGKRLDTIKIAMLEDDEPKEILLAYNSYDKNYNTRNATKTNTANMYNFLKPEYIKSVWGEAFGNTTTFDDKNDIPGYDSKTTGFVLGYDVDFLENYRAGVSYSYSLSKTENNTTSTNSQDTLDTTSHTISIYNLYAPNKFYAQLAISGTMHEYDQNRKISFGDYTKEAKSNFDGLQMSGTTEFGYNVVKKDKENPSNSLVITPNIGLLYSELQIDKYTETGADSASLEVDPSNYQMLEGRIGVKIASNKKIKETWLIQKSFAFNVNHDFLANKPKSTAKFVEDTDYFISEGNEPEATKYNVGCGLTIEKNERFSIGTKYDYTFNEEFKSHTVALNSTLKF